MTTTLTRETIEDLNALRKAEHGTSVVINLPCGSELTITRQNRAGFNFEVRDDNPFATTEDNDEARAIRQVPYVFFYVSDDALPMLEHIFGALNRESGRKL
jgi:hypothetical protein